MASIQAASAGRQALEGEILSTPMRPTKVTKPENLGSYAPRKNYKAVRTIGLQPIPMRSLSDRSLEISERRIALGNLRPQNQTFRMRPETPCMRSFLPHTPVRSDRKSAFHLKSQHPTRSRTNSTSKIDSQAPVELEEGYMDAAGNPCGKLLSPSLGKDIPSIRLLSYK